MDARINGSSIQPDAIRQSRLRAGMARNVRRCSAALALLAITLAAPLVHAQPTCPVVIAGGNGQNIDTFGVSLPLRFVQRGSFAEVPPTPVQFTATLTGNAVFDSGGQTRVVLAPWQAAGAPLVEALGELVIFAGPTPGPVTVTVQSNQCAKVAAPIVFNATIVQGVRPPITIESGDGALLSPGQTIDLVASVSFPDRTGGATRIPAGAVADFTVIAGDGSFTANGSSSIRVPFGNFNRATATLRAGQDEGPLVVEVSDPSGFFGPARFNLAVQRQREVRTISGDGQTGRPGTTSQPLVLEVRNTQGRPVAGAVVTWGIAFGVGPVVSRETTVTGTDGRTSNTVVFASTPTESIVVATLPGGETARFRLTSALAGVSVLSGNNQSGVLGSDADQPVVFQFSGDNGGAPNGEPVEFSVVGGSATLNATSDVVNDRGTASVRFRYGTTPGEVRIRAAFRSGQFSAIASAVALTGGTPTTTGNNQTGAAGSRLAQPFVVQLTQPPEGAKGLGGVTINWTVTAGGGRLDSATSVTDASGRASNQYTLGPAGGTNTVRASFPGGDSVVFNATATVTPTVPANATFEITAGNNQNLVTGSPSAPLVVRVRTAAGAPVPGASVAWRVTPVGNGGANPLTSVTNAAGEASTVVTLGLPGPAVVIASLPDNPSIAALNFSLNGGVENIPGLTSGQREVAGAIDVACPALFRQSQVGALSAGQQDLLARCSELVGGAAGSPDDVANALDQMLNDETAAQDDAAFSTATAQFDNLKARIAALRSGSAGIDLGGLALAGAGGALPLSFLPSNLVAGDAEGAAGDEVGADFARWGFFASGTIGRGDRDDEASSPGYEFDTYGLTAGVDYRWSDALVFGGALGYSNNDTDVNRDQGRLETRGYSGSLYAAWFPADAWYADAVLTYGSNSYDLSRRIRYQIGSGSAAQTIDQIASASPDGSQIQFALSAGRDFNRGAWGFGPYARVSMTRIDFDAYTERMSNPSAPGGGLAMSVADRELESLEGVVGGKLSYTMSTDWGILIPYSQIEWLHEFEDDPDAIVARFLNDPTGTAILVPQEDVDTDYFNLGLGLSAVFANGRSGFLYYERRAGQSGYSQDSLAVGVRIEF
jgi:outer membrane autotransporter protein